MPLNEENEQILNLWKNVSKSIDSFNHDLFTNHIKKESSNAEDSADNNSCISKALKKTLSRVSPKASPFECKTIQNNAYYKDQSLKKHPVCNLNYLHLRTESVDLSCSHCNSLETKPCKNTLKAAPCICENGACDKCYKDQQFFDHVKLRPFSVVLTDLKANKIGFDIKDFTNKRYLKEHKCYPTNKRYLEEHKCYPGFKTSGKFYSSVKKKDLSTSSNEHKLCLPEIQLFANKIPVKNAIIQLHPIEKTVAFCRNLNLQPVWKSSELHKSPVKLKNIPKLKKRMSCHMPKRKCAHGKLYKL